MVMFTVRNLGGIALFLAGTTWLWLTPAFATKGVSTSGAMWSATRVLCLLTIAGFSVATWALFARRDWWESAALASVALGVLALFTYAVAARGGETAGTVAWNLFVHVVMVVGILALLLVPPLERWVDGHVMGG
jgi:hypothetical protein